MKNRSVISKIFPHFIEQILLYPQCDYGEVFRSKHIRYEPLIIVLRWQPNIRHFATEDILHSVNSVYTPFPVFLIEAFQIESLMEVDHAHREHFPFLIVISYLFRCFVILAVFKIYFLPFTDQSMNLIQVFQEIECRGTTFIQNDTADELPDLCIGTHTLKFLYQCFLLKCCQEFVYRDRINDETYFIE